MSSSLLEQGWKAAGYTKKLIKVSYEELITLGLCNLFLLYLPTPLYA
jgi:hypothetical protein